MIGLILAFGAGALISAVSLSSPRRGFASVVPAPSGPDSPWVHLPSIWAMV